MGGRWGEAGDGARCRLQEEVEEEEVMTYRGPMGRRESALPRTPIPMGTLCARRQKINAIPWEI